MLLAVDIGNTNIHLGLHRDGEWLVTWRIRTVPDKMPDEYAVLVRSFFREEGLDFDEIEGVVIGSVVPKLTAAFTELSRRYLGHEPLIVGPGVRTGIRLKMDNPHEVGADRVTNAAAARKLYGCPAIVIDFGTATTFDVLSPEGDYVGGAIAPGIGISHDALVSRTARLHKVDLEPPPSPIGRNTVHAMQSGLFYGYVAMIEGMVERIQRALGCKAKVIATGGLAPLFAEHTDVIEVIAPYLTLDGLRLIYDMNLEA